MSLRAIALKPRLTAYGINRPLSGEPSLSRTSPAVNAVPTAGARSTSESSRSRFSADIARAVSRESVLLPQPNGFEGFLGSRVEIPSGDQSLLDRVDEAVAHHDPRVAAMRLASLAKGGYYPVPSPVDYLHWLGAEVVIRLHPGGAELEELIGAAKRVLTPQEGLEAREGRNHVL